MDCEAERELCRRYAGRIRGYGLRHLRDRASAEDLVQQVLLVLVRAAREGRLGEGDRLDGWVLVTCRNLAMDMRRGDLRQRRLAERSAAAELLVSGEPEWTSVDRQRLEGCLMGLDARERAVVLATFVDDRDADEIGKALELTPGNVRVIRHRALARLQTCVEGTTA